MFSIQSSSARSGAGVVEVPLRLIACGAALVYSVSILAAHLPLAFPVETDSWASRPGARWCCAATIVFLFLLLPLARRRLTTWTPLLLAPASLAGLAAWAGAAAAAVDRGVAVDPERPLAVGLVSILLGLGIPDGRRAVLACALVTAVSAGVAVAAGAGTGTVVAAVVWSTNVGVVCVLGGWGVRRGAVLEAEALTAVDTADREQRAAEESAQRRRREDSALHDGLLTIVTLLSHRGEGVDPAWLRRRCQEERPDAAATATASRPRDAEQPVAILLAEWAALGGFLGLSVTVRSLPGSAMAVLAPSAADALDGAVREAIRNVRLHAGVDRATIASWVERDADGGRPHVRIDVSDQGAGFDPTAASTTSGRDAHFGIDSSIVARSAAAGGWARVLAEPGAGTTVSLRMPLILDDADGAGAVRRPGPSTATRLRSGSRSAFVAIGWVGVVDAALMIALQPDGSTAPALTIGSVAVLAVLGLIVAWPKLRRVDAGNSSFRPPSSVTAAAFGLLLLAVTVAATASSVREHLFGSANPAVTGVSLVLAWAYQLWSIRTVLSLAALHLGALLALGLVLPEVEGLDVQTLARLVAETMVVPLGLAVYFAIAAQGVEKLADLDARADRADSARAAASEAERASTSRVEELRTLAAPLLERVGDGRAPLPLGDNDAALAAFLARRIRRTLDAGPRTTWLDTAADRIVGTSGVGRARHVAAATGIVVVDGERAADRIAPGNRAGLVDLLATVHASASGESLTVVVTDYGDCVGVDLVARAEGGSRALQAAAAAVGGSVSSEEDFLVVEAVLERDDGQHRHADRCDHPDGAL